MTEGWREEWLCQMVGTTPAKSKLPVSPGSYVSPEKDRGEMCASPGGTLYR